MSVRDQLTGTGEYLLRFWGSAQDAVAAACPVPVGRERGSAGAFYARFDTADERSAFCDLAMATARATPGTLGEGVVVLDTMNGPDTLFRTVAIPTFEWRGKRYTIEYDFGFGYPADSAEYMWREGNYACDCNRGAYLAGQHPEAADADTGECGHTIELVDFRVEKRR